MMTDAPAAPAIFDVLSSSAAIDVPAHPLPVDHDQLTAASSPSAVDEDAGVSPEVPPTVADTDHHDSPHPGKGAPDHIILDVIDNAGLEPKPELATEAFDHDGAPMVEEVPLKLQEADDAMDIDAGIVVEDVAVPEPQQVEVNGMQTDDAPAPAPLAANPVEPNGASPAHSNNTMPSTLDQLALSPKQPPSPSHILSRSHSPANPAAEALPTDDSAIPVDGLRTSSSTGSLSRPHDDTAMEEERPAKRQRSAYDESDPSSSRAPLASSFGPGFSLQQQKFAISTVRSLRRHRDAAPFNQPVDVVALNIPHYPTIITHPMDLSTIERKLNATKKGVASDGVDIYTGVDDFVADVRLIWNNSYTFNGREHAVSGMATRMSEIFERQLKNMPPYEEAKPVVAAPPRPAPIQTSAPVVKKAPPAARRQSTSGPASARRTDHSPIDSTLNVNTRPKREIHAPPPKDSGLPESSKHRANGAGPSAKSGASAEQLKFCQKLLNTLTSKQHSAWMFYFYDPVDANYVPNYYERIRNPMDLQTMKQKLEAGQYKNAGKFYEDLNLIYGNCMDFNPTGPVRDAGVKFKNLVDEKWQNLPPLKPFDSDDSGDDSEDLSDTEREKVIRSLEEQVATLNKSIEALRASQRDKRKRRERMKEERRAARQAAYEASYKSSVASSSAAKKGRTSSVSKAPVASPAATKQKHHHHKSTKKAPPKEEDDDGYDELDSALDQAQKKELSEAIEKLEGTKLEKVITIIQEGVPGIGNNSEEIELEIDALPSIVLQRLYNFVVRPLKGAKITNAYKVPKRTGSGNTGRTGAAATGGVKRKSMDEQAEAEKIRVLEERARIIASGNIPPTPTVSQGMGNGADEDDSVQSSDESGSESESDSE